MIAPLTSTPRSSPRPAWLYAVLLAGLTAAAYSQVHTFEFVLFDDDAYITQNSVVKQGLTWHGLVWAFTGGHVANWHPLTWLSHMADVEVFGLDPAGPHLVNLAFHVGNVLLLFYVMRRMTGHTSRSAFVAALFALHPCHVESVAWISERKDVLSTCFWFLATLAYLRYTEKRNALRYGVVVMLFAAGLMSKPMLVTLPIALLLLDLWPLRRTASTHPALLVLEKTPLLVLTAVSSATTFYVQREGGAMAAASSVTLYDRVSNAVIAYCMYLAKTFWPIRLSPIYPRPLDPFPVAYPVLAALLLVAIAIALLWAARRAPYAITGWLWYLITLVPVIGFVPIGYHSMADRYTYVPLIGVFWALTWSLSEWAKPAPWRRYALTTGAAVLIALLAGLTYVQTGVWRTSETLFRHAIWAVPGNAPAHIHLGVVYLHKNDPLAASKELELARQIWPNAPEVYTNLGAAYRMMGLLDQAIIQYEKAIRLAPLHWAPYSNLGVVYILKGIPDKASANLEKAVELNPGDVHARYMLAVVRAIQGRMPDSRTQLEAALRLDPDNATVRKALDALRRGELVPLGVDSTP